MSKPAEAFYQEDLAFVHDQDFSVIAHHAAQQIHQVLQERELPSATIIDLGCGSGVMAESLSQRGHSLIGVDYSGDILDIARRRVPQAQFVQSSFLDFDFPPAQVVAAIGEVITYLIDSRNDLGALRALFKRVYDCLDQRGFFILDFIQPGINRGERGQSRKIETEDWSLFIDYRESEAEQTLERDITLFRKLENGQYRRSREQHKVQLYSKASIIAALEEHGFRVKTQTHYNGHDFRPYHIAVIAVKAE